MKRVLFIYNRHAGKNKTWAGLSNIINAMTEEDCLVTAYPTQYRGDAGEAIVRWNKDFDQVVVAGGDGTLSEAIAGAVRLDEQPIIGYIPELSGSALLLIACVGIAIALYDYQTRVAIKQAAGSGFAANGGDDEDGI